MYTAIPHFILVQKLQAHSRDTVTNVVKPSQEYNTHMHTRHSPPMFPRLRRYHITQLAWNLPVSGLYLLVYADLREQWRSSFQPNYTLSSRQQPCLLTPTDNLKQQNQFRIKPKLHLLSLYFPCPGSDFVLIYCLKSISGDPCWLCQMQSR